MLLSKKYLNTLTTSRSKCRRNNLVIERQRSVTRAVELGTGVSWIISVEHTLSGVLSSMVYVRRCLPFFTNSHKNKLQSILFITYWIENCRLLRLYTTKFKIRYQPASPQDGGCSDQEPDLQTSSCEWDRASHSFSQVNVTIVLSSVSLVLGWAVVFTSLGQAGVMFCWKLDEIRVRFLSFKIETS